MEVRRKVHLLHWLSCKLNIYFSLWKISVFISIVHLEIIKEQWCPLNKKFPKRLVLSDEGEILKILNICSLVIFFLGYAFNEDNTNNIFFMKPGLVNENCNRLGIIFIISPNTNKRLNIFCSMSVVLIQTCFLIIIHIYLYIFSHCLFEGF